MGRSKPLLTPATTYERIRRKSVKGDLYQGDALAFLHGLADDSADLVFLDPPFNLGKVYTKRDKGLDRKPPAEYELWMSLMLHEAIRVLAPGGTLYLYHIPKWALRFAPILDQHLDFQHWIAVSMKNGFVRGRRLYPAHYALLMFTKGSARTFRRPRSAPARCRHCDEFVKDYGGYTAIIERKGVNLSDIWEDTSPVRHGKHKFRLANELPPLIFERVLQISGRKGGLYVDPFAGAGGGVAHAVRCGMHFAACDLLSSNCRLISSRLEGLIR